MTEEVTQQDRGGAGTRRRAAIWLAWGLCTASLLLLAFSALLIVLGWSEPLPPRWDPWWEQIVTIVGFSGAPLLGGFVASRRPENPYGWLWLAFGLGLALLGFAQPYAAYAQAADPGSLPAPQTIYATVGGMGFVVLITLVPLLLLLFPTGRPPSRRWLPLVWIIASTGVVLLVAALLSPGESGFVDAVVSLLLLAQAPAALSLVFRYHQASGVERQQIKWFAYAAALLAAFPALDVLWPRGLPEDAYFRTVSETATILGLYAAVGVAISRYRLYEIDRIINRTLVYGLLTATLVGIYFGAVVALQRVFVVLSGQESALAVVASTLAIAALFGPLRRRVQALVDRRFYRRKYDARKTLEGFSSKLRDETDLQALHDELVGAVEKTMQPSHVSLWLRPDRALRSEHPH